MGIYTCTDGTKVDLIISNDGTKFDIAEGTSDEDKVKFGKHIAE